MGIVRAEIIARARKAVKAGVSATRFYWDMKAQGLAYRKTDMLADYRNIKGVERVEGALRFVRKDRYPAKQALASVTWTLSKEFMYKVKVQSRISPDEPITERFVNIMSDKPLTPAEMETQIVREWGEWERYAAEEITQLQVWSAVRRVME